MVAGAYRFGGFLLDLQDRRLSGDDGPVELNGRYLDALALLVRERGRLVRKDRFLEEVWRGVPVTDEALTQCVRTLRRRLGDDAARPRFIETVPKHGYRFIAPVEQVGVEAIETNAGGREEARSHDGRAILVQGGAGTIGGGVAGLVGGILYGFGAAAEPLRSGIGAASVLLVLVCVTLLVSLIGGAGVAFGIAWARAASGRIGPWCIVGGALGGLVVGAIVKLLGLDAFNLLFGRSPGDITGAPEGALLGGAVGLGVWIAGRGRPDRLRRRLAGAALAGAGAGIVVALLGGRLMGGSLDLLGRHFPGSHLRLDAIGALFGEAGFGPVTRLVTGAAEGALFAACIAAAMLLAPRRPAGAH